MKSLKKNVSVGLSLLMVAIAMTGCGNSNEAKKESTTEQSSVAKGIKEASDEQVTITFSLWDEIQSVVYQELIDKFEEQNPNIKVTLQLTPWDQYWTKFDAAAGANQAADVFFMNVWVPKYAEAGVLEPLDSYMERDKFNFSLYSQSTIQSGTYNEVHYTVPKGADSLAVVINTALFEKYGVKEPTDGWTWDDMQSICKELKLNIKAAGDSMYPMAFALTSQNGSWLPVIYQFGGELYNDDGTSALANKESIAAIQSLTNMIDEGLIPDYQMISDTSAEELFISGQTCMTYLPTFSAQKIESAKMERVKLIQIPKAKTQAFSAGTMHYGMNSASQNKEEAWKFLQYLASEEVNDLIGQKGIDLPAMISSQGFYADSFKQFSGMAFAEGLQHVVPFEEAPAYASDAINSIANEKIINIFTKNIGVEEGLKQMASDINAEIESGK